MISAPFSGCPYFCTGQVIVSSQKETIGLKIGKGDISMSQRNLKVISIESADKVYHNKNCQYALRMRKKNKTMVTKQEAKQMGYRPCKCCNSMSYRFKEEGNMAEDFSKKNQMETYFLNSILYVKTEIGLWKIAYSRKNQKCILYHGNFPYKELDICDADTAKYYIQRDSKHANTIMQHLEYILKHDRFRKQVEEAGGNEMAVSMNKKYAKQRRHRMQRQAYRRLNHIFAVLEQKHAEYVKLSFC